MHLAVEVLARDNVDDGRWQRMINWHATADRRKIATRTGWTDRRERARDAISQSREDGRLGGGPDENSVAFVETAGGRKRGVGNG